MLTCQNVYVYSISISITSLLYVFLLSPRAKFEIFLLFYSARSISIENQRHVNKDMFCSSTLTSVITCIIYMYYLYGYINILLVGIYKQYNDMYFVKSTHNPTLNEFLPNTLYVQIYSFVYTFKGKRLFITNVINNLNPSLKIYIKEYSIFKTTFISRYYGCNICITGNEA